MAQNNNKSQHSAKLPVISRVPERKLSYYQKFIVVSEDGRPMAFSGEQFCYCTNEDWQDPQWPVQVYSRKDAEKLIEATVKYRQEQGFDVGRYLLMPVWAHG
jgi:hypothetical protein